MRVEVRDNNVNDAIRKLKKKMFNEGIINELKERRFFEKPSDKKRRKKKESIRLAKKEQAKRDAIW